MDTNDPKGYDLFISYSRASDNRLAKDLQNKVKRIGLPLWKLSRRRVFRDVDGTHASADTRKHLIEQLSRSRYMALLACPESATSEWVQCELAAWLTNFKHTEWMPKKGVPYPAQDVDQERVNRLILCHTGGQLVRPASAQDFDWLQTDALPDHLRGVFVASPVWQDLTDRRADGKIHQEVLTIGAAVIAGAISDPPRTPEQIMARDRKQWVSLVGAFALLVLGLFFAGGVAYWKWQDAEREFRNAKRIVDDDFTQIAYDMKDLPGAAALRLELMRKAQQYYTEFLGRRSGSALDEDMAVAIFNVGLIQMELGQDAGPQFQAAVDFLQRRAAANPGDINLQRDWMASLYNVAISEINRGQFQNAEREITHVIALQVGMREKFPNDRHLELDYWNSYIGLTRAVAEQGVERFNEVIEIARQARQGLTDLLEKLSNDPNTEYRTIVTELAQEYLADGMLNLANIKSLDLQVRMQYAEEAWRNSEKLTGQRPTDPQRFARTARACRLMAILWNMFGDKGNAVVFGERGLLIDFRLARNFTGNKVFREQFGRDLSSLMQLGLWKHEAWFHEAALKALEAVYEVNPNADATARRAQEHRLALAHAELAATMLRGYCSVSL